MVRLWWSECQGRPAGNQLAASHSSMSLTVRFRISIINMRLCGSLFFSFTLLFLLVSMFVRWFIPAPNLPFSRRPTLRLKATTGHY